MTGARMRCAGTNGVGETSAGRCYFIWRRLDDTHAPQEAVSQRDTKKCPCLLAVRRLLSIADRRVAGSFLRSTLTFDRLRYAQKSPVEAGLVLWDYQL